MWALNSERFRTRDSLGIVDIVFEQCLASGGLFDETGTELVVESFCNFITERGSRGAGSQSGVFVASSDNSATCRARAAAEWAGI